MGIPASITIRIFRKYLIVEIRQVLIYTDLNEMYNKTKY